MSDLEIKTALDWLDKLSARSSIKTCAIINTCMTALREKQERGQTAPLTLEELRGMNDERVWVQFSDVGMYALVSHHKEGDDDYDDEDGENVYLTNNLGGRSAYEDIISEGGKIYRRPPERSE